MTRTIDIEMCGEVHRLEINEWHDVHPIARYRVQLSTLLLVLEMTTMRSRFESVVTSVGTIVADEDIDRTLIEQMPADVLLQIIAEFLPRSTNEYNAPIETGRLRRDFVEYEHEYEHESDDVERADDDESDAYDTPWFVTDD